MRITWPSSNVSSQRWASSQTTLTTTRCRGKARLKRCSTRCATLKMVTLSFPGKREFFVCMDRTLLACLDQICLELTFNSMMVAWTLPCLNSYQKISYQHRNCFRRLNTTLTFSRKNQEHWGHSFRRAKCSTDLKIYSLSLIIHAAATP